MQVHGPEGGLGLGVSEKTSEAQRSEWSAQPTCPPPPTHPQEAGLEQQGLPIQKGCPGFGGGDFFHPHGSKPPAPTPTHFYLYTLCPKPLRPTRAPDTPALGQRWQRGGVRARRGGRGAFKARVRPASAGAGRRAAGGASAGDRAASPAVRSARNRGAGGWEAGGLTARGSARRGAGGVEPAERRRRAASSGLRHREDGRRARRGRKDARGLGRARPAALALRRAPGKLPPPALAARSPGRAGPSPEPAERAFTRKGSPGFTAPAARPAAESRLPRPAKPPAVGRSAEPGSGERRRGAVRECRWLAGWDGDRRSSARRGPAEHPSAALGPRLLRRARFARAWAG